MTHHMRHQMRDQMRDQMRSAWPALDSWQVQLTKGGVRIGDVERDEAARALGEHFASGRLERDEYDERLTAVFAARTWGDLAPLFRDLPNPGPVATSRPLPRPMATRPRFRLPFLPVLLILIGVAILSGTPWVFWIGLGAFLILRRSRHTSGSWRPPRGSWS